MITNLEHIGLSVFNLERSIDFYCKNLNCEVIRIIEANPENKLGKVVGLDGCSARIAHLKAGDNMFELFEYITPKGKKNIKEPQTSGPGLYTCRIYFNGCQG